MKYIFSFTIFIIIGIFTINKSTCQESNIHLNEKTLDNTTDTKQGQQNFLTNQQKPPKHIRRRTGKNIIVQATLSLHDKEDTKNN
uniref:Secreted protein n=1 Tax=Strongyloides venezuelensis TaxID=75913 RepID=A0A0K0FEM1_STRVS